MMGERRTDALMHEARFGGSRSFRPMHLRASAAHECCRYNEFVAWGAVGRLDVYAAPPTAFPEAMRAIAAGPLDG
jgi:hypothetical protein